MKIYNEEKTKILAQYDLTKGYLKPDTLDIEETQAVEEKSHLELIKEYSNGGKSYKKVVDVKGQPYMPAHKEEIYVYIAFTDFELRKIANEKEIQECLQYLQDTDYITSKLAEAESEFIETGDNTEVLALRQHYANELATRKIKRERIRELGKMLQQ